MGADKAFLSEFEVSGEGEDAKIMLAAPALVYENDIVDSELVVSRPPDASTPYLQVSLSYEGDTSMVSGLPDSVVFAAGKDTVTIPFRAIDDGEKSGDRSFTVKVAPGEGYEAAQADGITVTVVDDESSGGEVVWTGAAGNLLWDDPKNWSPERVPGFNDSPRFTSSGLTANDTVLIGSNARIAKLIIETVTPFTLGVAGAGGASLTLGGVERRDVEGDEGAHTIAVPLRLYTRGDGNCIWDIAGAGQVELNVVSTKLTEPFTFYKTGGALLLLTVENAIPDGTLKVLAGEVKETVARGVRGKIEIGGGESPAVFTANDNCAYGISPTVWTNGSFRSWGDSGTDGVDNFNIHEGGYAYLKSTYGGKFDFWGGELEIGYRVWSGTYGQHITVHQSDETARMIGNAEASGYYDHSITIEDGAQPIDFVFAGSLDKGAAGKKFTVSGAGTMQTTRGWGNNYNPQMSNLTWLMDNVDANGVLQGSGSGNGSLTVGATATLRGVGRFGGNNASQTLTVDGTLAPGSITESGEDVYGTFTVGSEANANAVSLGANATLRIGFAPTRDGDGRRATAFDKLLVNGTLTLDAASKLVLVADPESLSDLHGGTYTILSATDGITGDFAEIVKPKKVWKVNKVTEKVMVDDVKTDVVKALTVTIPGHGLVIIID